MANDVNQVAERLATGETGMQTWLWLPLMELLALGDPVDVADLAAATGRPMGEIRGALEAIADTEYDGSGRIVGQGLTQRPTQHRFEVDGEQLYTWCALDTLIFPILLGAPARIESSYKSTRTPVRLCVDSSGVTSVEPATAVVSLVNPEDTSSVRSSFCNQVHFFASPEEAGPWLETHPRRHGHPCLGGLPARLHHGRTDARRDGHQEQGEAGQRGTKLQLLTPTAPEPFPGGQTRLGSKGTTPV